MALQKKVEELERGLSERSETINSVTKKNQELKAENEVLRALLAQRGLPEVQWPPATQDELRILQSCAAVRALACL